MNDSFSIMQIFQSTLQNLDKLFAVVLSSFIVKLSIWAFRTNAGLNKSYIQLKSKLACPSTSNLYFWQTVHFQVFKQSNLIWWALQFPKFQFREPWSAFRFWRQAAENYLVDDSLFNLKRQITYCFAVSFHLLPFAMRADYHTCCTILDVR